MTDKKIVPQFLATVQRFHPEASTLPPYEHDIAVCLTGRFCYGRSSKPEVEDYIDKVEVRKSFQGENARRIAIRDNNELADPFWIKMSSLKPIISSDNRQIIWPIDVLEKEATTVGMITE